MNEHIAAHYQRERNRYLDFARRRLPSMEDAEDLVQEIFSDAMLRNNLLEPIELIGAWIFRALKNRIIDSYRKQASQPLKNGVDRMDMEQLVDRDTIPELDILRRSSYDRIELALESALSQLPEEQRDIIIENIILGKTFDAIARESGISRNTLIARKHYAIEKLRRLIPDYRQLLEDLYEL